MWCGADLHSMLFDFSNWVTPALRPKSRTHIVLGVINLDEKGNSIDGMEQHASPGINFTFQ